MLVRALFLVCRQPPYCIFTWWTERANPGVSSSSNDTNPIMRAPPSLKLNQLPKAPSLYIITLGVKVNINLGGTKLPQCSPYLNYLGCFIKIIVSSVSTRDWFNRSEIISINNYIFSKYFNWFLRSDKFEKTTKFNLGDFPDGAVIKNQPANAGDAGSSPGPGRSHMPRSN